MKKFFSRRFLLALAPLVLEAVGVSLPPEVIGAVATFIAGESAVDFASARKQG